MGREVDDRLHCQSSLENEHNARNINNRIPRSYFEDLTVVNNIQFI